jgi:RND family efflux transporter MFP subunit
VRTAKSELGTLVERGSYPGELMTDAAELASNVPGRLLEVRVRIGDRVEKKQELARIDATDWMRQREEALAETRAAGAAARRAAAELDAARRDLSRVKDLVDDQVVSAQQGDALATRVASLSAELEAAQAEKARAKASVAVLEQKIADCRLLAPFDGVVSNRYVDPGAFLTAGAPILRVVASGPLMVRFEVPESNASMLRKDAAVVVRASSDRSEAAGKVSGIGGEIDRARRIVRAEAIIENPPEPWLPGMFAEVVLTLRSHEERVLVPDVAIVSRAGAHGREDNGVFVADGDVAQWIPVRVLAREGRKIAIEGELQAGADVLIAGHIDLGDGARIRRLDETR